MASVLHCEDDDYTLTEEQAVQSDLNVGSDIDESASDTSEGTVQSAPETATPDSTPVGQPSASLEPSSHAQGSARPDVKPRSDLSPAGFSNESPRTQSQ